MKKFRPCQYCYGESDEYDPETLRPLSQREVCVRQNACDAYGLWEEDSEEDGE